MKIPNYDWKRFENVKSEPSEVLETFKELAYNYIQESWLDPQFREDYENVEKALENYTELVKRDEAMKVTNKPINVSFDMCGNRYEEGHPYYTQDYMETENNYYCPNCSYYFGDSPLDFGKHCHNCGQHLDRSDVK